MTQRRKLPQTGRKVLELAYRRRDSKDYLAEMAKSYTTEEQRRIHDGGSATAITPQAIDFF